MRDEPAGDPVAADLPPDLAAWLEERAAEANVEPAELLTRFVTAYRAAEGAESVDEVPTAEDVDQLHRELDALQSDVDEKIGDVRQRVIQVKREADAKAPAQHDHEKLAAELSTLKDRMEVLAEEAGTSEEFENEIASLSTRIEELEENTKSGFENFETILEDLIDRADELETRLETLGRAAVRLQDAIKEFRTQTSAREQVESIHREANRKNIEQAACEDCGATIDISLLTEPACPECGESFAGVKRRSRFWQSHMARTGEPPAIAEGETKRVEIDEDILPERNPGDSS